MKLKVGSRKQVMNGIAMKTGGGLTKKDLKYNKYGKVISIKMSKIAKKRYKNNQKGGVYYTRNPLRHSSSRHLSSRHLSSKNSSSENTALSKLKKDIDNLEKKNNEIRKNFNKKKSELIKEMKKKKKSIRFNDISGKKRNEALKSVEAFALDSNKKLNNSFSSNLFENLNKQIKELKNFKDKYQKSYEFQYLKKAKNALQLQRQRLLKQVRDKL